MTLSQKLLLDSVKGFVFVIALIVVCFAVWLFAFASDTNKYSLIYNVDFKAVRADKQPHDCEYGTAPLGNKNCHYVKQVDVTKNSNGHAIAVWVHWNKVQD